MAAHVQHVNVDAELRQCRRAAGELHRVENIRRLIDEIAGEHHAVGDCRRARPGLLGGGGIGAGKIDLDASRPLVVFLALGLVAVERIGSQPHAKRQISNLIGL